MKYIKLFDHISDDFSLAKGNLENRDINSDLSEIKDIFQEIADEYFLMQSDILKNKAVNYYGLVNLGLVNLIECGEDRMCLVHKAVGFYDPINKKFAKEILIKIFIGFNLKDTLGPKKLGDDLEILMGKLRRFGYEPRLKIVENLEDKYYQYIEIKIEI